MDVSGLAKIRYLILVISGLSDVPSEQLDNKTPLEVADTPNMDSISINGRIGLVETVSEDVPAGSDKTFLSLLGYSPDDYPIRRGPLEAAGLGLDIDEDDLALRLNFVSTFNGMLVDHNAGQISSAEAATLIKMLKARFGDEQTLFYYGAGYRNLLILKKGKDLDFKTVPPHDALHQPVVDFYPYGSDARIISDLMDRAHDELVNHDINLVRVDLGENPADRIWLWGEGKDFDLPAFDTFFPLKGCVISAAPLLMGISRKIGFHHIAVSGATGYSDTDYESKAKEALRAMNEYDLVVVHVGAVNEVCRQGDLRAKVSTIEEVDRRLVGPVIKGLNRFDRWRVMITTDHITPAEESLPLRWPVPVAFGGYEVTPVRRYPFNEECAKKSDLFVEKGSDLMEFYLGIKRI